MRSRCENCVFYSTWTHTCDYLEHTGVPRITICPPENECTVFKAKSGKRVKWDVVRGYHLYMEGKSWQEIATAVGVSRDKVYAYGCKYWPKRTKAEETKQEMRQEMRQEMKEETKVRKNYTDIPAENNAPIPIPIPIPVAPAPAVKAEAAPTAKPVVVSTPVTLLDLLEAAIGDRQGVDAYLTGEAVSRLINWKEKTDLEQARDAIKLLILRLQEK